MAVLEFDFNKARHQASELEELSERLEKLVTETYDGAIQGLSSGWKGDGANAFLKKAEQLQEQMLKSAQDTQAAAQTFQWVIQTVEAAERAAAEIAGVRAK